MRNKNPWIHYGILLLIYSTGLLTLLMHTLFHAIVHGESRLAIPYKICQHVGKSYTLTIHQQLFIPEKLIVKRCDVIKIINQDQAVYLPAFGDHPHDLDYAGFPGRVLGYGQAESFVVHTPGTYLLHDHLRDHLNGTLIIR